MKKLSELIIKLRIPIVIITFLITMILGYFIKDIKVNSDILSYLPKDDNAAALFNSVGKKYGGNDMALIVVQSDDIFQKDVLEHIKQLTDSIKVLDGIGTVTSITDVIDIKGSDWGIEIGKLIDTYDMPETSEELDSIKHYVLSKEMYNGSLISSDATTTLIVAKIINNNGDKQSITNNIKRIATELNIPEKIYYGGIPFMIFEISNIISHDMFGLGFAAFILIAFILLLSFKTARGVILPLLTVIISSIWTIGIMGLLDFEITLITSIIPVILLAVGSAYTIHVINRINEEKDQDRKKALIKAIAYIIVPVFLASITTMVGFISFIFGSYLSMIRDFGLFTALGVFFSLLLSVTFVPSLISIFQSKSKSALSKARADKSTLLNNFLKNLSIAIFKHPKYSFTIWSIVLIISIIGMFKVERRVDMIDYFKEGSTIRKTEKLLQDKFSGSLPVYVTVKGNIQSPDVLNTMDKVQSFMETNEYMKQTQSVADLIKEMNEIMGEGKTIPDSEEKIQQLWFLLDGQDIMEQLVSYDLDEGLIQGNISTTDNEALSDFSDDLEQFIKENQSDDCEMEVTGIPSLYERLDHSIVSSQANSLILAIILVFIIVALLLKSPLKGFFAIIPIGATLLLLFGFMGFTGIPLDIATVLVGSISVGIGIDYAIHMITHFEEDYKKTKSIQSALEESIKISGRAIVINVLSVSLGFLILLFSNLVPLQRFGLLVAVTMISSGVATLTLMPVVINLISRRIKIKS
jgi:predicted RND superfamily exporter protein